MPDHDAGVFSPPVEHQRHSVDSVVEFIFSGFRRWDGVYFIHIAQYGYTYENTVAFFPLYPLTVRLVACTVLYPLHYFMSYFSVLLIAGFLINVFCFVNAAKVLYELSTLILKDDALAYKAVQLFCINPASIFFTAYYSESMFALLTFKGMLCVEKSSLIKASLWFGFSTLCRSNGLVNTGYILYYCVKELTSQVKNIYASSFVNIKTLLISVSSVIALNMIPCFIYSVFCCLPFVLYQYYISTMYCDIFKTSKDLPQHILNYGYVNGYKMAFSSKAEWCNNAVVPVSYTYIQSKHWNQGFMKYYEYKQIPNFILATPMVTLSILSIISYCRRNLKHCLSLGLLSDEVGEQKKNDDNSAYYSFHSKRGFVYMVHLGFLVVCGVFFMHVQVITRFVCSSSPVIFWYVAYIMTPEDSLRPATQRNLYNIFVKNTVISSPTSATTGEAKEHKQGDSNAETSNSERNISISRTNSEASSSDGMLDWDNQTCLNKLIFVYFHLYFFVGIGAFSNFLPWT